MYGFQAGGTHSTEMLSCYTHGFTQNTSSLITLHLIDNQREIGFFANVMSTEYFTLSLGVKPSMQTCSIL